MIENRTRSTRLHGDPVWALTTLQRTLGFMFSTPGERCKIFLFMPAKREVIHMWFVFGPIDCVALDGQGTVIAMKENFQPWRVWNPKVKMSALVELPAGTIERTNTQLGDRVQLPQPPL